jgi:hypothetical protein
MMLPLFVSWDEIIAMTLGGLLMGAVVAAGRGLNAPWFGAAGAAALFLVLRGSLNALGLLVGTISTEAVLRTSPPMLD